MYLNNLSVNPDFENISLMNLLNTEEMNFSLAHISTLLEFEEDNDEIDINNIFDTLAIQQPSLSNYDNDNEAPLHDNAIIEDIVIPITNPSNHAVHIRMNDNVTNQLSDNVEGSKTKPCMFVR